MRRLPRAMTAWAAAGATVLCMGGASLKAAPEAAALSECNPHSNAYVCRAPAPTPTAPAATPRSPSSSLTDAAAACVTSLHSGSCGPYAYSQITNSNGYNTYVGNNMWACGPDSDTTSCDPQTLTATGPGNWKVVSNQRAGNTGVLTYPDTQQLTNNWNGSGWGGANRNDDTPISGLSQLTSSYAETMPRTSGTDAQAAWDIWLSNNSGHPSEIMVWVDNVNRGNGGATFKASATVGGQAWTLYQYGTGEIIWSLGARGKYQQQASGTVDLLALLRYLQANAYIAASANIGQIDFGWEICSTGGVSGTFTVSSYSISMAPSGAAAGTAWRSWGGQINSAPDALTFTNFVSGELAIGRGVGNRVWYRRGHSGAADGPWQPLGGYATSKPSAASTSAGQVVAVRSGNNAVFVRRSVYLKNGTVGWRPWQSLGGVLTSAPDAAYLAGYATNGEAGQKPVLYVFARGRNNSMYEWTASHGWQTLGGLITSDPGAVGAYIAGQDRMYVFARSRNNELYYRTLTSGWQSLGGSLASGPDASFDGYRLVVAVLGTDHAVHYRTLSRGGGNWSNWRSVGGSGIYGLGLTGDAVSRSQANSGGNTFVFTTGTGQKLWAARVCDSTRCF